MLATKCYSATIVVFLLFPNPSDYALAPAQTIPAPPPGRRQDLFQGLQQLGNFLNVPQLLGNRRPQQNNNTAALFLRCIPVPAVCDPHQRFRNLDGTCNNLGTPSQGGTLFPFRRLLPPDYEDFVGVPRGGINSETLPNARETSVAFFPRREILDSKHTHLHMSWGQLIAHDVTLSPDRSSQLDCCNQPGRASECFPVAVSPRDPFYARNFPGETCHNFTRAVQFCNQQPFEQINQRTSFLDLDNVYGSDDETHVELRAFQGGLLRTNDRFPDELLPFSRPNFNRAPTSVQHGPSKGQMSFMAGDERVNQNQMITSLQTLCLREHNRLAATIGSLRPDWSDDVIFNEARRIAVAEVQSFAYMEYLPVVLGLDYLATQDLLLGSHHTHYDANLDPSMGSEFVAAAFRFGHTQIANFVSQFAGGRKTGGHLLREDFENNRELLQPGGIDRTVGGLVHQLAHAPDPIVALDAGEFLFGTTRHEDLFTRDIQRGRDYGTAGYVHYRTVCHLSPIKSYEELPDEFTPENWKRLQTMYRSPEDIDLYIGGFWEIPLPGAMVGPTFACIMADQFKRMRDGDRYFFTHLENPARFTKPQIDEILQRRLSDFICENAHLDEIQEFAFFAPGKHNPYRPCTQRRPLNVPLLIHGV